tara:strand:- start:424 stop:2424 length:2001 start_codon:yes stop_codon:yes gene_type:complete
MGTQSIDQHISNYDQWKHSLARQFEHFTAWGREHGALSPEIANSIERARRLLAQEHFTLAFVGEFSRGKTELINALLFNGLGQRLLPSTPGRTTMCPTEIYCETGPKAHNNCVRLLPIETRRTTTSMHSFKRIPQKWITLNFDPSDAEQIKKAIGQVSATKYVSIEDARKLGFDASHFSVVDNQVEIPAWRHALITLEHPLLRHGLRIIDTPGLNALGNEPELTLRTLPSAQAIVFLLAADSGVSASEMTIWQEHIDELRKRQNLQVLTLLNKVDTLWDDLLSDTEISANVDHIRQQTAGLLGMPLKDVIALSAKQGLLGKATHDHARLERSNFVPFEEAIANSIVHHRLRIASQPVVADILTIFENTRQSLKCRLFDCDAELKKMAASHSPTEQQTVLTELRGNIRQIHSRHHKLALSLRSSQHLLERQRQSLTGPVDHDLLDNQIREAQQILSHSWTSLGLSRALGTFYQILEHNLDNLEREAEQANRVLASIYNRREHGPSRNELLHRHLFRVDDYRLRLQHLTQRANNFRRSIDTLLTSKSNILNRFINTLVREIREIYSDINIAIDHWIKEAMAPLIQHNMYQKQLLDRHMLRLAKINNENQNIDDELRELRNNIASYEQALQTLDNILKEAERNPPKPSLIPETGKVVSLDQAQQTVRAY